MFKLTMAITATAALISVQAHAACKWTHQLTEERYRKDHVMSERPRVEKTSCAEGVPPICTGFIFCADTAQTEAGLPPGSEAVACKAVQFRNKWVCPDADSCANDGDVKMQKLAKNPEPIASPPDGPPPPAKAPAGAVR